MQVLASPTFDTLFTLPAEVLRNAQRLLAPLAERGAKVVLSSNTSFAANLRRRGILRGLRVVGALSDSRAVPDARRRLPIVTLADAVRDGIEAVVIVDPTSHEELVPRLLAASATPSARVIDLYDGFDPRALRRDTAHQLSQIESVSCARDVLVRMPRWGLGDSLCALSATRELARRHPELRVHFDAVPEVMTAFGDELVTAGSGWSIDIARPDAMYCFWESYAGVAKNYLGCYYLSLGLDFDNTPALELPRLPPPPGLAPGSYAVLQPRAGGVFGLPHLRLRELQRIIDSSPLPVVLAGKQGSDLGLRDADLRFLGGALKMLQVIQHAALVLTPRSASAHVAAAYRVPSVVWLPTDCLNWHLDYPDWPRAQLSAAADNIAASASAHARSLLHLASDAAPLSPRRSWPTRLARALQMRRARIVDFFRIDPTVQATLEYLGLLWRRGFGFFVGLFPVQLRQRIKQTGPGALLRALLIRRESAPVDDN